MNAEDYKLAALGDADAQVRVRLPGHKTSIVHLPGL